VRSENETTPLAWVWSQYSATTSPTETVGAVREAKKLENKYLYAAAAVALFVFAAIYKESSETNAPHQPNNAEMAEAQITRALGYLKEAYKISPRADTEKVITQVEKIQRP